MNNLPRAALPPSPINSFSACESGNALVELAISLPLFLVLILGTAEIANLAWASVQINNAARAGAAYASLSRINAADGANIQLAAQNEAPQLLRTTGAFVLSTPNCSCVDSSGSSTTINCDPSALTSCPSPSTIQVNIQVITQAPVTTFVHYPGLPATYIVRAQATTGVSQ
jgi:Flp pilus assembly protein TadG